MIRRYVSMLARIAVNPANTVSFGTSTFVSGNTYTDNDIANIVGSGAVAGAVVSVQVTTYTVAATGGGTNTTAQLTVNGVVRVLGDSFNITLDGTGNGSFNVSVRGGTNSGDTLRVIFTLETTTIGTINSAANTKQFSKII